MSSLRGVRRRSRYKIKEREKQEKYEKNKITVHFKDRSGNNIFLVSNEELKVG